MKFYSKVSGIVDINPDGLPGYFLILAGPRSAGPSSRGKTAQWLINDAANGLLPLTDEQRRLLACFGAPNA